MSDADIDYIEQQLKGTTTGMKSKWPPTKSQPNWYNAYTRLESMRSSITPVPTPPPVPPTPTPLPSGVIAGVGLFKAGTSPGNIPNKDKYELLEVSWDDAPLIGNIPGRAIMYVQGSGIEPTWNVGVTYDEAKANNWLASTTATSYGDFPSKLGDDAFIAAFISNVLAKLKASPGVDGIFIDNVIENLAGLYGTNSTYPDYASYLAASTKFAIRVGAAIKTAGYEVIFNAGAYIPNDSRSNDASTWQMWWQQLGPYCTYLCCENFQETSEGSLTLRKTGTDSWMKFFDGWQRLPSWAHAAGAKFLGITYGDLNRAVYGRVATLLEYKQGDIFCNDDQLLNDAWSYDVGQPLGAKVQAGSGVWTRAFEHANVRLDANNAIATISPK